MPIEVERQYTAQQERDTGFHQRVSFRAARYASAATSDAVAALWSTVIGSDGMSAIAAMPRSGATEASATSSKAARRSMRRMR